MKRIIVAIPHSHSWLWTQTCVASLLKNPPRAGGFSVKIIVVDNSPWSPAIKGIKETALGKLPGLHVIPNYKTNRFHASALDCIIERFEFDYLMAWETDVLALHPDWLQWFMNQMRETDFAVGMWHHEQFINPSCTLYRGDVLREMNRWCKGTGYLLKTWGNRNPSLAAVPADELRWGPDFSLTAPLDPNLNMQLTGNPQLVEMKSWIAGPFAEKRGFAEGTILKEQPTGQLKGPGWYEPGQQLHHWAVQAGYTYTICQTQTGKRNDDLPLQTLYGSSFKDEELWKKACNQQLEPYEMMDNAYTAHMWGGTRALDILKHPVTCQFVKSNTPMWLAREARFWRQVVSEDIQTQTLELIRKHDWHITGQGSDHVSDRDREAAEYVKQCYREGGVDI